MKKIFLVMAAFAMAMSFGFTSCGDNDDISNPHVLTDDEIAEMKRQDSIKQEQMNKIDADLILEYTVEDYPSSQWTNKSLSIDFDKIGEVFGLTGEQVKNGINEEDGAPEIKGFAIMGSNHADYSTASTTNGTWGHWWNLKGDPCKYAEGSLAFFCEWDRKAFTVGQNPGAVKEGDSFVAYECLKYGDKRVAIKINFNIIAREEIKATVVDNQELAAEFSISSESYEGTQVDLDIKSVLAKLGVSSAKDLQVIGFDANGGFVQEYTAGAGYWYDKDGYPCAYGDDAKAFIEYYGNQDDAEEGDDSYLNIGQYPGHLAAGDTFKLPIGFLANNKIVKVVVSVTAKEAAATPAE